MMATMDQEARKRLGEAVRRTRTAVGLSIDQAAEAGGMSPVTWSRVEQGKAVRELSYAGVERVFGWTAGSVGLVSKGKDPVNLPDAGQRAAITADEARRIARQLPLEVLRKIVREELRESAQGADLAAADRSRPWNEVIDALPDLSDTEKWLAINAITSWRSTQPQAKGDSEESA
ncbi:hypothetical protein DP939_02120 [Spongiactinospora rosea]|uniref:Uncharacterized protein n=1 Tax=Spongiactinospora rosea TaxID=2248750 RepID=A0A366M5N5_9ACTN|nr:helix-turn-helix transcriptional regulator [Spongiactinospora rosea]RBQ21526.1 hypothetical protein DP939_02120 [Spongiactinospora rosea]